MFRSSLFVGLNNQALTRTCGTRLRNKRKLWNYSLCFKANRGITHTFGATQEASYEQQITGVKNDTARQLLKYCCCEERRKERRLLRAGVFARLVSDRSSLESTHTCVHLQSGTDTVELTNRSFVSKRRRIQQQPSHPNVLAQLISVN